MLKLKTVGILSTIHLFCCSYTDGKSTKKSVLIDQVLIAITNTAGKTTTLKNMILLNEDMNFFS